MIRNDDLYSDPFPSSCSFPDLEHLEREQRFQRHRHPLQLRLRFDPIHRFGVG